MVNGSLSVLYTIKSITVLYVYQSSSFAHWGTSGFHSPAVKDVPTAFAQPDSLTFATAPLIWTGHSPLSRNNHRPCPRIPSARGPLPCVSPLVKRRAKAAAVSASAAYPPEITHSCLISEKERTGISLNVILFLICNMIVALLCAMCLCC